LIKKAKIVLFALACLFVMNMIVSIGYGSPNKASDIFLKIIFNAQSRTAEYRITVNTEIAPENVSFIAKVNNDTLQARFEAVSKDLGIYKAEIDGETLIPIDLNGPQNFPLDQYEIEISLFLPFPPGMVNQVFQPALNAPRLMVSVHPIETNPSHTKFVLSRPFFIQLIFFSTGALPLLAFLPVKYANIFFGAGPAESLLTYYLQWVPSRNSPSYFDLIWICSTVAAIVWKIEGLRRLVIKGLKGLAAITSRMAN